MSLYDYNKARELTSDESVSFYSLILAAIRKADTVNLHKLKMMFPGRVEEAELRYNAPGGLISGDPGYEELQKERKKFFKDDTK